MAGNPGFDRRTALKGGLTVTAVGAFGSLTARAANAELAAGAAPEPTIHSTAAWGARPPSGAITIENHKPTYIVVHHTVDPGNTSDFSLERAYWASRAIQNFHMDTRGWIDTGQQFTNSRGGHITEGRHESLKTLRGGTKHVQGANVGGYNSQVIGIENEGLYTEVDVTPALWNSLVKLVAYMASQYGIGTANIKGHRDFNSTECPGGVLYGRLPELRTAVGNTLGTRVEQPLEWPLLKPGDTGPKVLAAQHLLRDSGASNVPTDGIFGQSTKDAVAGLVAARRIEPHQCTASAHVDETGFFGADIWPQLARPVKPGTDSEAARAAAVLTDAAGARSSGTPELSTQAWKELLNG
ncbi:peptidoglycan recognition protein family protein [Amycolatopsis magusensis]|uniref:peptidoglycan recognition protein family protein n=1 Tax=Amycolatopsis magusensis TaxID=882444 RepID=UPI0024A9CBCC|nr:N-acetylmuramoyl-L-alanine amidase [Amycolatopsis magusensis]MDI5976428.1 N-acetylmuramoyl-L-alanine amidase [Amycolatopsis magusensis]